MTTWMSRKTSAASTWTCASRKQPKHSKLPPLWIGNNDIRGDEFEGERLKNVPHGMNRVQEARCLLHFFGTKSATGSS